MDGLERIRNTLTAAGLLVYDPSECRGVCQAAYTVVRDMGTYPMSGNKTGYTLAEVINFVPIDNYDQLAAYTAQVKALLQPLKAQVRPTGNISPDMIREEYKAHQKSVEYMILKTL